MKTRYETVDLYAKAGLWYDALREALEPADDAMKKVAANLLKDLAKSEQPQAVIAH